MSNGLEQFKQIFITECFELLGEMEERLLTLDGDNANTEDLNAIFRCAHSIKGSAGAFGLERIASFTHVLEALLDGMREGKIDPAREVIDTLLRARDALISMVSAARDNQDVAPDFAADLQAQLLAHSQGGGASGAAAPHAAPAAPPPAPAAAGRVRIRFAPHADMLVQGNEPLLLIRELRRMGTMTITAHGEAVPALDAIDPERCYLYWEMELETGQKLSAIREVFEFVEDECDLVIEQLDATAAAPPASADAPKTAEVAKTQPAATKTDPAPSTTSGNAAKPDAAAAAPPATQGATSIRVDIEKVDRLINMVGEVVIIQAMLTAQSGRLPPQEFSELIRGIDELCQHTRELQEAVMAVRMQPVKSIFSRMPRLVRDLSQQLGKDIRLETSGETTEVDKTIIEQLSDPLTHMIRNSVDHGIEKPELRRERGKPAQGVIHLSAEHRGGRIVIEVRDDGGGINRERVLAKAREKGLIAADAALADGEIDNLIFAAGFSTAEVVSNVSGRGVGMDVVKRNIEALGGTVAVQNNPGFGSVLTISLPLTLAILDGMIVRVGTECYIIPINNIIETMRPRKDAVQHIADGNCVINVRGAFIPVLYLHRIFNIAGAEGDASKALVVLVENAGTQLGLVVDELLGQQQVVIKTLEENADPIQGVSGATILGDGKVSLILDIAGLHRMGQAHPIKIAA